MLDSKIFKIIRTHRGTIFSFVLFLCPKSVIFKILQNTNFPILFSWILMFEVFFFKTLAKKINYNQLKYQNDLLTMKFNSFSLISTSQSLFEKVPLEIQTVSSNLHLFLFLPMISFWSTWWFTIYLDSVNYPS